MNLKLFVYTVNEYLRFREELFYDEPKGIIGENDGQEYIYINIRLMLLRKYFNKKEKVSIVNIAKEAMKSFPTNKEVFQNIIDEYNEIQNNQAIHILSDQTELNIYETIEDSIYGLYLHADERRIKNILLTQETLRFHLIKEYVLSIEKLTIRLQYELRKFGVDEDIVEEIELEPVIRYGELPENKVENHGNKRWKNLSGEVLLEESFLVEEHRKIIKPCWDFINECNSGEYRPKNLKKYTYSNKEIDENILLKTYYEINKFHDIGMTNRIQFNENKTEALASFLPYVQNSFQVKSDYIISTGVSFLLRKTFIGWKIKEIYINGKKVKC